MLSLLELLLSLPILFDESEKHPRRFFWGMLAVMVAAVAFIGFQAWAIDSDPKPAVEQEKPEAESRFVRFAKWMMVKE